MEPEPRWTRVSGSIAEKAHSRPPSRPTGSGRRTHSPVLLPLAHPRAAGLGRHRQRVTTDELTGTDGRLEASRGRVRPCRGCLGRERPGVSCWRAHHAPRGSGARLTLRRGLQPGLTFQTAEATEFLTGHPDSFDVVLSIFGPVWFTDPATLLPLVRQSLAPGGVFAFSHRPARPDQEPKGALKEARAVSRWDYSSRQWSALLSSARFTNITAEIVGPPTGECEGTLVVRAER